jgi:hypothetical protein
MATFCPARGAALPSVHDRSLPRVVGLVLVQGSVSPSHTHTITITYTHDYHTYAVSTHVTLSVCPFSLLGGSWGWWWVHERERGLGCFCAALSFSGEQRTWRLAKTRRARLKTPLCAHTGALEPMEGYPLHCFPLL